MAFFIYSITHLEEFLLKFPIYAYKCVLDSVYLLSFALSFECVSANLDWFCSGANHCQKHLKANIRKNHPTDPIFFIKSFFFVLRKPCWWRVKFIQMDLKYCVTYMFTKFYYDTLIFPALRRILKFRVPSFKTLPTIEGARYNSNFFDNCRP